MKYLAKLGDYYIAECIIGLVAQKSSARRFFTKREAKEFVKKFWNRKPSEIIIETIYE